MEPMQDELAAAIAADLGITNLPAEEQNTLISQFGEVALKAATLSIVQQLGDAKREAFAKLAEAGDAQALKVFLDAEVPNHEEIVKQAVGAEVQRFREFQLEDAGKKESE